MLALINDDLMLRDYAPLVQDPSLSFGRLPKLEMIFIRHVIVDMPFGSHFKVLLDRTVPDAVMEAGWVLRDCRLGVHWWAVYDI